MELQIQPVGGQHHAGGSSVILVHASTDRNTDVQSGQVELVCTEQWWDEESGPEGPALVIRTADRHRQSQVFLGATTLTKALGHRRELEFPIPVDAPPTAYGSLVQVAWKASARLELTNGETITTYREVAVGSGNPGGQNPPDSRVFLEGNFGESSLVLVFTAATVATGGYLEGELRVHMERNEPVSEIRMELHTREKAGAREADVVRERAVLERDVQLAAGRPYVWPFSLAVPDRRLPTLEPERSNLEQTTVAWRLRCAVHTGGEEPAYLIEQDVHIYTVG